MSQTPPTLSLSDTMKLASSFWPHTTMTAGGGGGGSTSGSGSSTPINGVTPPAGNVKRPSRQTSASRGPVQEQLAHPNQNLYKTELCRSFTESGFCRYGAKCQFAHGLGELRPIQRHKKYKTEKCKNFQRDGVCPYGPRCRFIHNEDTSNMNGSVDASMPTSPFASDLDETRSDGGVGVDQFGLGEVNGQLNGVYHEDSAYRLADPTHPHRKYSEAKHTHSLSDASGKLAQVFSDLSLLVSSQSASAFDDLPTPQTPLHHRLTQTAHSLSLPSALLSSAIQQARLQRSASPRVIASLGSTSTESSEPASGHYDHARTMSPPGGINTSLQSCMPLSDPPSANSDRSPYSSGGKLHMNLSATQPLPLRPTRGPLVDNSPGASGSPSPIYHNGHKTRPPNPKHPAFNSKSLPKFVSQAMTANPPDMSTGSPPLPGALSPASSGSSLSPIADSLPPAGPVLSRPSSATPQASPAPLPLGPALNAAVAAVPAAGATATGAAAGATAAPAAPAGPGAGKGHVSSYSLGAAPAANGSSTSNGSKSSPPKSTSSASDRKTRRLPVFATLARVDGEGNVIVRPVEAEDEGDSDHEDEAQQQQQQAPAQTGPEQTAEAV